MNRMKAKLGFFHGGNRLFQHGRSIFFDVGINDSL